MTDSSRTPRGRAEEGLTLVAHFRARLKALGHTPDRSISSLPDMVAMVAGLGRVPGLDIDLHDAEALLDHLVAGYEVGYLKALLSAQEDGR